MSHAVLFLYLSVRVVWQAPASQQAGHTKKRSDQARHTRTTSSTLQENDDDFETVGHTPGVKVHFIVYLST